MLVAVFTASLVIFRLTTPARPPRRKPVKPSVPFAPDAPAPPEDRPPKIRPAPLATEETVLAAIMTSASIEPPVWPTLTPRELIKLSIFRLTFRKATAQRNQIRTLPATASRPTAETLFSTSLSVMARAGRAQTQTRISVIMHMRIKGRSRFRMITSIYRDRGFAMNAPTMLIKSRRHHAFITNRNTWPANIRHQLRKILEVFWEAPMAMAIGAV